MAKIQPTGNPANPQSWENAFTPGEERAEVQTTLARLGVNSFERREQAITKRALGYDKFNKLVSARYDWLFDDLQKFTSIGAENIRTKEDLKNFVKETMGKSPAWESMKQSNPRKFNASITKATNSFWEFGDIKNVAKTNIVEKVTPERADKFRPLVKEKSQKIFIEASAREELFRIRRENFVIRRRDKRGRIYHYDVRTGRRFRNPETILKELGF